MAKIKTYRSDDYTGLDVGKYHFYFGYEQTYCPKCKKLFSHEECEKHDSDLQQWAFVATSGKEVIFFKAIKYTEFESVEQGFYIGMGHFLQMLLSRLCLKCSIE